MERKVEGKGRRGRRHKLLRDDLKETKYWKLKEEALDRIFWRAPFGIVCGYNRKTLLDGE